jgi:hypothetical protein
MNNLQTENSKQIPNIATYPGHVNGQPIGNIVAENVGMTRKVQIMEITS